MSRKKFIESLGATCDNWTWSWSFVNHDKKFVVFGAWDIHEEPARCLILEPSWQIKKNGKKNGGFKQALRHIKLCENEGYALKTFRMFHEEGNTETGTAKIKGFESEPVDRVLIKEHGAWYAYAAAVSHTLSEDIGRTDEIFVEGSRKSVTSTVIERNAEARQSCLLKYGLDCTVCEFNFQKVFGSHGHGYIHVHHLNPIAATSGEYIIDPIEDLRPVCPNCHAMLHRGQGKNPLSINELKDIMKKAKAS